MASTHLCKLAEIPPQNSNEGGYRIIANQKNFPILKGMSLYKVGLAARGIREPHWHANADELGYCLKGKVIVNLYQTGDVKDSFLVGPGDAFLIPSGALHDIENAGEEPAELILSFSNELTEDFDLSTTMSIFSDAVLGNTWGLPADYFSQFARSEKSVFAAQVEKVAPPAEALRYESPFRFSLEASEPLVANGGGAARMARQNVWPIVKRQALYSLILTDKGMREPHWHPETAEMGYVHKGTGRMTIYSPSGKIDTYEMQEGDLYFIPKAYPHHIENLSAGDLHFLIFFDQAMPRDIGFTGSVKSFSDQTLGASTHNPPAFFEKFQKHYEDLFIVDRINPLD